MGYQRIIVGTDGSDTAALAEQWAARLAKRFKSELLIVSAYPRESATREQALLVAEGCRERLSDQRLETKVEVQGGEPADVILTVAERRNADLIVVGNRGMGKAKRFRLGSVPEKVATYGPCDVIIRDTTSAKASEMRSYEKVLIATDGSPTATEAARKGFEMAMLLGGDVTLVYVGDPMLGAIALERTGDTAPEGIAVEQRILEGDPADAICDVAINEEHELVVVGNKGMAGTRRFLLGSVPNRVAHYCRADILIAKTVGLGIEDILPGHGGVIDEDGRRMAIYRDESGAVNAISPRCTHMGCTVDWNDAEKTWDCPCHGSRYDASGEVIRGPAEKGLAKMDLVT
jgi:nucleotide-binding universal stress UspA family protein/nitrite reductase/ring-hydroxylating ferredoxin subunit